MKKWLLPTALLLVTIWASWSTYLYWQLKNNPKVIAVTTGNPSSALSQENFQLGEMEKITFLRQYLDRYFSYDSNNFWQTQTSLSFLMAPELRDKRIEEIRRLRDKIQQRNHTQRAQLISLSSDGPNQFAAVMALQMMDENQKSELNISLHLELNSTERTLENPWGLLVRRMDFLKSSTDPIQLTNQLKIRNKVPLTLTLPCAIENLESPASSSLKTKITTMNVSEIQLTTEVSLPEPVTLKALCKDTEFSFEVANANKGEDLFKSFPLTAGTVRKKELPPAPHKRSKDMYDKAYEKIFGTKLKQ